MGLRPTAPMRRDERGGVPAVHPWAGGFTWIAHPDERMTRASHAIATGADGSLATGGPNGSADRAVWVIEPVDAAGIDDRLAELGSVAGVVVLAELHRRDAAAVARRHDVPVYLPACVGWLADRIDAETRVFDVALPGTTFEPITVLHGVPWAEAVLHDPTSGTLVATEVLVSSQRTTGPGERLAVGPYVRLVPPRKALSGLPVERVLVGHGEPLTDDASAALDHALANARWGLPAYLVSDLWFMLQAGWVAVRR